MRVALFRTPVADVRAKLASLLGERTVAGDRIDAQTADRGALDAAGRAAIFAFLADHVRETVAALGRAVVAGGDAVLGALIQMMTHVVFPLAEIGRYWRARNAYPGKQRSFPMLGNIEVERRPQLQSRNRAEWYRSAPALCRVTPTITMVVI